MDNKTSTNYVNPEVQVMMLGARRTGKTSMLASMYNSFSSVVAGTNLIMSKIGGKAIDDSLEHMKALFREEGIIENDVVKGVDDYDQTNGFDQIDFLLSITGKKERPKIVRFVDCSGEWINQRTNEIEIGIKIEKSDIVIIAIDTVTLMEKKGKYNSYNKVQAVTEFIINNMKPDEIINNKKMVLFVPMKCEKYYHQNNDKGTIFYNNRMEEIVKRIKEEYFQLLNFLTSPNNKKYFTVGVCPVLTLGGIEFDVFKFDDPEKDIVELNTSNFQFRYCQPMTYEPKYCNRPLIYSLLFVQQKISDDYFSKAYNNNNKKKILASVQEWFQDRLNLPKSIDYINELKKVAHNISTEHYPGLVLIQDPDAIEN